jgi:hypothetical protein
MVFIGQTLQAYFCKESRAENFGAVKLARN